MPMTSRIRTGEVLAFGSAALSGAFPVLTAATVATLTPLYAAGIATAISSVFFACVLSLKGRWKEMLQRAAWGDMLATSMCIAVGYYGLLFTGLRYTTPGNGAVIGLLQIFFTVLIVNILWKHEPCSVRHAAGAACMVSGALLILLPQWSGQAHAGDLLIVFASMVAPVGNVYAQRARKIVSSETIMFVRSGIGFAFLLLLALIFEPRLQWTQLGAVWWQVALNGVFILGLSKIFWLEAIHRLPITKTLTLSMSGVLVTFALSYVFLGQQVTTAQLLSIPPMALGLWLLTKPVATWQEQ